MEFEKWSIRLRFEIEKMMNTFEGDKVWWWNLKWYSGMKLQFERWKCESEIWRMKNLCARKVEIDKFKKWKFKDYWKSEMIKYEAKKVYRLEK